MYVYTYYIFTVGDWLLGMGRDEYMQRLARAGSMPQLLRELPAPLRILIEKCWNRNPALRPTCSQILELLNAARNMVH